MKRNWRVWGMCLLVTLGSGILGYFGGAALNRLVASDALVRWQALGSPPGGADWFVAADKGLQSDAVELSVKSTTGDTYISYGQKDGAWELTTNTSGQVLYDCAESFTKNRDPSYDQLPGEPVRCGSVIWSWEWTTDTDLFVILADGSVWRWHVKHPFGEAIAWQCGTPLVFGLVGLAVYLTVRRVLSAKNKPWGFSNEN